MNASNASFKVMALGEALWDIFPDGRRLGGAPLNFAAHARALGADAALVSRVGEDVEGAELLRAVARLGMPASLIQRDSAHATGRVKVTLDAQGHPSFEIVANSAWDHLAATPAARELALTAEAVCFGTLAQRRPASRRTIQALVATARQSKARLVVCDINFRQNYYSREVVEASLRLATALKLNETELPALLELLQMPHGNDGVRWLLGEYELRLLCVTMGARGCRIHEGAGWSDFPGYVVKVADTVGAGDAFTAGLTARLLLGDTPAAAADFANRVGAHVASRPGGAPPLDMDAIMSLRRA